MQHSHNGVDQLNLWDDPTYQGDKTRSYHLSLRPKSYAVESFQLRPIPSKLRRAVIDRAGHRCERCSVDEKLVRLEVHHQSYRRVGTAREIDDCVAWCVDCHNDEYWSRRDSA